MDGLSNLAFGATAAFSGAAGLYGAYKCFKDLDRRQLSREPENNSDDNLKLRGTDRSTNCLAILADGTVRLRDGGYMRGYVFRPKESLYYDAATVEQIYDKLAQMLRTQLPENSGLQIRPARSEDDGSLLRKMRAEQTAAEADENVHLTAAELKHQRLDFYLKLAGGGFFNRTNHTIWVYIPIKTASDKLTNPVTSLLSAIQARGIKKAFRELADTESDLRVRLVEDEREAFQKADEYFRRLTSVSPVKLTQFDRDEIRQVLYTNYNEDAESIPLFPNNPNVDLKSILLREKIKSNKNWYLLHGKTPVTIINVFNLPEANDEIEGCFAGMMRPLKNTGVLRGRMTPITEYIFLDKEKNKKFLNASIKETKKNAAMGIVEDDDKAKEVAERRDVKRTLSSASRNMIKMRFYVIVYGSPATTAEELKQSTEILKKDCDEIIKIIHNNFPGADAALEDPEALRAIYEKTLIGNFDAAPRGREFLEECDAFACFAPIEDASQGQTEKAHSFFSTTTGTLYGLNIFRNKLMSVASVLILGESRSGKSVLASIIIEDILASIPETRVIGCEYGGSMRAMTEMLGERYLGFDPSDPKTINIWDYPGLENAEKPTAAQIDFVTEDTLILLSIKEDTEIGALQKSIIRKCVTEVYETEVPRNDPSVGRRNEPVLSHLVQKLATAKFNSPETTTEARRLSERLSVYRKNVWLDSPTDETYRAESKLDIFDLKTIGNGFPREVKRCLAYRLGALMHRAYGRTVGGQLTPLVILFDECHKYVNDPDLRFVIKAADTAARQGGKDFVASLFVTHRYEDIQEFPGITENIAACFVGRQNNTDALARDRGWNRTTVQEVKNLQNEKGAYSQFVLNFGKGDTQSTSVVQIYLDPISLWNRTSDPVERNARELVHRTFPHWSTSRVVFFLASLYHRGLTNAGLDKIDERFLNQARIEDLRERAEFERIQEEIRLLSPVEEKAAPEISLAEQIGLDLTEFETAGLKNFNNPGVSKNADF